MSIKSVDNNRITLNNTSGSIILVVLNTLGFMSEREKCLT